MKYETWAVLDGQTPEFLRHHENIATAALQLAGLLASHDPNRWTFWIQRPGNMSQENPEGLSLYDVLVLQTARDLAQSRRRRRVHLANAGQRLGVACKGRDLSELLRASIAVVQGKAIVARALPSDEQLAEVQFQLRFA